MYEYKSQKELYNNLIPALNVKLRLLKNNNYDNITRIDIWNYLIETKWRSSRNLMLSDIVNDILYAEEKKIDEFIKLKISKLERSQCFDDKNMEIL